MRRRSGFTIVELLTVMALIGVLVGIAVPRYRGMKKRATAAAIFADVHAIRIAAMSYYTESGKFPADAPDEPTRLGITATRKVGNAVTRNRLRRLAREAFRLDLPDLPHGHIIVINFLPNAADLRLDALRSRLQSVWREAKLLNRDTGAGG